MNPAPDTSNNTWSSPNKLEFFLVYSTMFALFVKYYGSLEISVVDTRILGCKRACAGLHPKIRPSSRQILESQS